MIDRVISNKAVDFVDFQIAVYQIVFCPLESKRANNFRKALVGIVLKKPGKIGFVVMKYIR